jgi:hypothetical protein
MISIVCFKWNKAGYRSKFTHEHVHVLRDMIKRNTNVPFKFFCITDDPEGLDVDVNFIPLWDNPAPQYGTEDRPNCFYRLKMFSPEMKEIIGERFLWLDLDTVILRNIDDILNDQSDFKIWKVDGEEMPCNGSMVLHRAGTRPYIWERFDPARVCKNHSLKRVNGFNGSDQAFIAECLTQDDRFFTKADGVFSFRCHIKERTNRLPDGAKIVFFHGAYDPWHDRIKEQYNWVKENYKCNQEV